VESERFRSFSYDELVSRDKANLDITWLKDASLEDLEALPAPESSHGRWSTTSRLHSPSSRRWRQPSRRRPARAAPPPSKPDAVR
jgi:hypothetical protein